VQSYDMQPMPVAHLLTSTLTADLSTFGSMSDVTIPLSVKYIGAVRNLHLTAAKLRGSRRHDFEATNEDGKRRHTVTH